MRRNLSEQNHVFRNKQWKKKLQCGNMFYASPDRSCNGTVQYNGFHANFTTGIVWKIESDVRSSRKQFDS